MRNANTISNITIEHNEPEFCSQEDVHCDVVAEVVTIEPEKPNQFECIKQPAQRESFACDKRYN